MEVESDAYWEYKERVVGADEVAQKVKVLASKGEDLGSIPGTHREVTSRAL